LPLGQDPELLAARKARLAAAKAKRAPPNMTDGLPQDEEDTDEVLAYARRVAKLQIGSIEKMADKKITPDEANARARDARTLNELVRTLERLDALEKNRKLSGRRTKTKHDAELKAALVRRLDQLAAASRARDAAGGTE
jgi:hypothetical protein